MLKSSFGGCRQTRRDQAFTLAELLIVIAIIAVLIGILLPSLAAARRSANSVKCLASLRDLGTAFQQYAQENNRYFPVVRWYPVAGTINSTEGPNTTDRVWIDFLARYVHKRETQGNPQKYKEVQYSSVFWGCPSYDANNFVESATDGRQYALSYGMSVYSMAPYGLKSNSPAFTGAEISGFGLTAKPNIAVVTPGLTPSPTGYSSGKGEFYKMEQWGRRSQDKGLLADSNGYDIVASASFGGGLAGITGAWSKANESAANASVSVQPKSMGLDYPLSGGAPSGGMISVDGTRHLSPTASKKKVFSQKGINMLFVDGHAASVSPGEAFIAVKGAGIDVRWP